MKDSKELERRKKLTKQLKQAVRDFKQIEQEVNALAYEVENPQMRMTAVYSDMPRGGGSGSMSGIEKALKQRDYMIGELFKAEEKYKAVLSLSYKERFISDFIYSGESLRGFAKIVGVSRWKVNKLIDEAIERHINDLLERGVTL